MDKQILKPKDLADMLNVTVKTLQRWDNDGTLKAYRNPKGRRYYTLDQYNDVMGIHDENKVGKCIIYLKLGEKTPIFKECYGLSPMSKWGMNRLWARDGTSPS